MASAAALAATQGAARDRGDTVCCAAAEVRVAAPGAGMTDAGRAALGAAIGAWSPLASGAAAEGIALVENAGADSGTGAGAGGKSTLGGSVELAVADRLGAAGCAGGGVSPFTGTFLRG